MEDIKEPNEEFKEYYNIEFLDSVSSNKNSEEIENEYLALESIYPELIKPLSFELIPSSIPKEKICKFFMISFYTKTPPNFKLIIQEDLDKFSFQSLKYLPVVDLVMLIPYTYPNVAPPIYKLDSIWLSKPQLHEMSKQLAPFTPGNTIIFSWCNYLLESWINDFNTACQGELSISDSSYYHFIIDYLLEFNEKKIKEELTKNFYDCLICMNQVAGSKCVILNQCEHIFCLSCIVDYLEDSIFKSYVDKLVCPMNDCSKYIREKQLKEILPLKTYEKYEEFSIKKAFTSSSEVEWCPRCEKISFKENQDSLHAQCSVCKYNFCIKCREKYHPFKRCESSTMDLLKDINFEKLKTMDKEQISKNMPIISQIVNSLCADKRSQLYVKNFTQSCPNCKTLINKDGGCNKVFCTKCNKYMCWICRIEISSYDHFKEGKCQLFEEDPTKKNKANFDKIDEKIFLENLNVVINSKVDFVTKCPTCSKLLIKINSDNLISCKNCKINFCFICETICEADHYNNSINCIRHN